MIAFFEKYSYIYILYLFIKNKIIEKALRIYLDQLNCAEYIKSYKKNADDISIVDIAEEGMEDYLKQIEQ